MYYIELEVEVEVEVEAIKNDNNEIIHYLGVLETLLKK